MTWRELLRKGSGIGPAQLDRPVLFIQPGGMTAFEVGAVVRARDDTLIMDKTTKAPRSIRKGECFLST